MQSDNQMSNDVWTCRLAYTFDMWRLLTIKLWTSYIISYFLAMGGLIASNSSASLSSVYSLEWTPIPTARELWIKCMQQASFFFPIKSSEKSNILVIFWATKITSAALIMLTNLAHSFTLLYNKLSDKLIKENWNSSSALFHLEYVGSSSFLLWIDVLYSNWNYFFNSPFDFSWIKLFLSFPVYDGQWCFGASSYPHWCNQISKLQGCWW